MNTPPLSHEMQRMEHTVEELSARIARLAIGLGVPLQTDAQVAQAMSYHSTPHTESERRANADRREASRAGMTAERREDYQRSELRALLVMRYDLEADFVAAVGLVATRQILMESETNLEREGFQPGASGIDLDRLFKES